ncbi:hypothetical protein [Glaciibacter psychrotolerans]|nr:hypothetical protein [Leifsonia psychrotolerans]
MSERLDGVLAMILAVVAAVGAWLSGRSKRIRELEARVEELEATNRAQWLYIQDLINHIYRGKPAPPPPPPEGLLT